MSMKQLAGSIGLLNIRRNSMSPTRLLDRRDVGRDRFERRVVVVGARELEELARCPRARRRAPSACRRRLRASSFPCRAPARASGRPRSSGLRARARLRRAAPPSHRSQRYLRRSAVRCRRSASEAAIWLSCSASMARRSFGANENYSRSAILRPCPAMGFRRCIALGDGAGAVSTYHGGVFAAALAGVAARARPTPPCTRPKASRRATPCPPRCRPDTLAFAFRDDKLLVGGADDAPVVPHARRRSRALRHRRRPRITSASSTASAASRCRLPTTPPEPAGLALRRPALAVLRAARAAARARRARVPGRRMGPHAPLLRPLRHADARQGRRAREGVPGVRPTSRIRACRRR